MALQNQVETPLTPAQIAAVKAEAAKAAYAGFTDAQIAAALNAPRQTANPAPAGRVPKAIITKAAAQDLLTSVIVELIAATPPNQALLTTYQYVQSQVNAHDGDYAPGDVGPYAQRMIADGLITALQVTAFTTDPDPAYQAVLLQDPLAWYLMGGIPAIIEAADVTAAKASA